MRFNTPAGSLRRSPLQPTPSGRGLNKVTISLSEDSGPVAIRNVQLQLKQNWKHFDYILTPATR